MKQIFLMLALLCSATVLQAQIPQNSWCGTEVTEEYIQYLKSEAGNRKASQRAKISDGVIGVPVTIHIIAEDNGTGGISLSDVESAIDITNGYFANANMYFFIDGSVNQINDSDYYNFQREREGGIANDNDVRNTVNIYFANTVTASGQNLCGYATFPGGADRVVMANGCTPNGLTLAHELGHYFKLYHPHEVAFGAELVDGSNCTTAGDLLCSTPADPNLSGKVSYNNNVCSYTGTNRDANGDFYSPDITNIMSYSLDACQNSMTGEQYERMRQTLEEERSYLKLQYEDFAVLFDADRTQGCAPLVVRFEDESIGAFQRSWVFDGGFPSTSQSQTPTIQFENPGYYNVSLEVTSAGGESLNAIKESYIEVIDPEAGLTRETFDRSFSDGNVLGPNWELINEDPNVSLEVAPVSADGGSGSLLIPNFNNPVINETEYIITPAIDFADLNTVTVSFDRAYAFQASELNQSDTLELLYRQRCDSEWFFLTRFYGDQLTTGTVAADEEYVPSGDEWGTLEYTYVRGNLENGASVQFALRSVNGNGNNIYVDNIAAAPNYEIAAPTIDNAEFRSGNRIIVRYTDNANNEREFAIERSINGSEFEQIATTLRNSNAYADENLTESGEYVYRIRALGEFSNSGYSNEFLVSTTVTSIEDDLHETGISFYPNPASQSLFITSDRELIRNISLVSLTGVELYSSTDAVLQKELDLSRFAEGIYLLRIHTARASGTYRILVSR